MECQFCHKILSTISALNFHQTKTKYCLEIQGKTVDTKEKCEFCNIFLANKSSLKRHINSCKSKYNNTENRILELENEINMLKNTIKELREDKKNIQERYDLLSLTAVKRPTTSNKNIQINNYIKNMPPLMDSDIYENVSMLTLDHHVMGAEGYAKYALEFPFKNKIVCVDVSRNKIKYKNEDGDIIEDVGFKKMMTKLCEELKTRSFNLSQEHYEKLSKKFSEKDMDGFNFMETAIAISKYAVGRENEFCNKIIRIISKGSMV